VREYTEDHYLPATNAYHSRAANQGAIGQQMVDWQRSLEQQWATVHFGAVKVQTRGGQLIFEAQVCLHRLNPKAVRVELYANGINHGSPVRQEMALLHPLADESGGYLYRAAVSAARPATDYTARVIPYCEGVASPLEESRILWQR
jgi:starch phosphorylase